MKKKIILIESSNFFGRAVKQQIETHLGHQVLWYKEFDEYNNFPNQNIDLVILEYELDKNATLLDKFSSNEIPIVLLTTHINTEIQEKIWTFKIIDYVLKGNSHSLAGIIDIVTRFFENPQKGILIVDNSMESRIHLKTILSVYKYKIIEANSRKEALNALLKNPDIHLVITDYHPPALDGLQLTSEIRRKYPVDRLAIIGLSAQGNHSLKIQFIKSGANDFINKPFISELLFCRITQNLKIVEYFHKLKGMALVDQLTQLSNRHYLRETGEILFQNARRNGAFFIVAMIDIDNFKVINDTYGHDVGDIVLKSLSKTLINSTRKSDLVCRYGGEEFIIIGNNLNPKNALTFFDNLRQKIFDNPIYIKDNEIKISVSIGVCIEKEESLDKMINSADLRMYEAKTTGKNRVCI